MKRYHAILGGLAAAALLITVGTMDANDSQQQAKIYNEKVCSGVHPDYKQLGVKCAE